MAARDAEPSPLDGAAKPVLQMIDDLDLRAKRGAARLVDEAQGLLDRFEGDAARGSTVKPARYGLAVLLDHRARTLPQIDLATWSVLARRQLFDGRDMSLARIREFHRTAAAQGGSFADLEQFLRGLLARAETARDAHRRRDSGGWRWKDAGFALVLALALVGYAGFLEYPPVSA